MVAKKSTPPVQTTPPAQLTRERVKPIVKKAIAPVDEGPVAEVKREPTSKKISSDKYVRYCEDTNQEEKKIFADKVHKGELSYGYYAIDNDKGYHYFLIIKK